MREEDIACEDYILRYLHLYEEEYKGVDPESIKEIMKFAFLNGFLRGQISELKKLS